MVSFTARHEVFGEGKTWMGLHLLGVAITSLMVMVPLSAYLLIVYPGWSTLYFFDSSELSAWNILGLLIALPLFGSLGYMLGISLCKWFGMLGSVVIFLLSLAGMIVLIFFYPGELSHISGQLGGKDTPSFFSGDLLAIFAFSFPLMLGGWLFVFTLYEVEGRKVVRASGTGMSSMDVGSSFSPPISVKVPSIMEKEFIVPNLASDDKSGEQSGGGIRSGDDSSAGSESSSQ